MAGLAGLGVTGAAGEAKADLTYSRGFSTTEKPTSKEDITTYNNFYEFGVDKSDPAENSGKFKPRPWTVRIDGA